MYENFVKWFEMLITGSSTALSWLSTTINFGAGEFTALEILTFGGLSVYLIAAIVKWVVS